MRWNPDSRPPDITAHRTVAFVAEQLAFELFDAMRSQNYFNTFVKENNLDENKFAQHYAPHFKKAARAILAKQLQDPSVPEQQKNDIVEALTLDQLIPKGGTSIVNKKHYK